VILVSATTISAPPSTSRTRRLTNFIATFKPPLEISSPTPVPPATAPQTIGSNPTVNQTLVMMIVTPAIRS